MNRILIIEDDELISTVYARKYLDAGFETAIAPDGATGLELAASFKPDLIHLDLNVPKVNGVEIIKRHFFTCNLSDLFDIGAHLSRDDGQEM